MCSAPGPFPPSPQEGVLLALECLKPDCTSWGKRWVGKTTWIRVPRSRNTGGSHPTGEEPRGARPAGRGGLPCDPVTPPGRACDGGIAITPTTGAHLFVRTGPLERGVSFQADFCPCRLRSDRFDPSR